MFFSAIPTYIYLSVCQSIYLSIYHCNTPSRRLCAGARCRRAECELKDERLNVKSPVKTSARIIVKNNASDLRHQKCLLVTHPNDNYSPGPVLFVGQLGTDA